ncbi:MAG: hypothetical protein U9P79_06615 [Candidatus Cloacimonadota bacterium]|nr:hypothetical protein [Candidatus Cloacimonadota bacterium]
MNNFIKEMENLQIPNIENASFQNTLKNQIHSKYFTAAESYRLKFRFAIGFATAIFLVLLIFIINPQIPTNINSIAFNLQTAKPGNEIDESYAKYQNIRYTSLENPVIGRNIEPGRYKEDNAYLIRKYSADNNDAILVVSEFGQSDSNYKTQTSY